MAIPGGAYGIYSGYNMKAGGDRLTGRDEKTPICSGSHYYRFNYEKQNVCFPVLKVQKVCLQNEVEKIYRNLIIRNLNKFLMF